MASSSASSSSSTLFVTREEFNAFYKHDRNVFRRLVSNLRRDRSQSLQVMSFLNYLEKSIPVRNLIVNLDLSPDPFINSVANEVSMCVNCLHFNDFSTFISQCDPNSFTLPSLVQITQHQLTLLYIYQNRENILSEMNKHFTNICQPAFQDIYLTNTQNALITRPFQIGMPLPQTSNVVAALLTRYEQVMPRDRTVFLISTQGYALSEAQLYGFFTGRFGNIIESIRVDEVRGNNQVLIYATMVLNSVDKIPEIVSGDNNTNTFTIYGIQFRVQKYSPM